MDMTNIPAAFHAETAIKEVEKYALSGKDEILTELI
jgi:hypothetical protein